MRNDWEENVSNELCLVQSSSLVSNLKEKHKTIQETES